MVARKYNFPAFGLQLVKGGRLVKEPTRTSHGHILVLVRGLSRGQPSSTDQHASPSLWGSDGVVVDGDIPLSPDSFLCRPTARPLARLPTHTAASVFEHPIAL